MAEFKTNVPVVQADPVVTVEVKRDDPLPVGRQRFRLVVVDEAGNESEPAFLELTVLDTEKPTAVLDVVDANGRVLQPTVSAGSSFILSAARSSDLPPGKIKEYHFTLLDMVG
jgi:hypothetical protein